MLQESTRIKLSPCGDLYELVEDATVTFLGVALVVAAGFKYDGASIPRMLWIPIGSPYHPGFMRGALFHDSLYRSHVQPKDFADKLFHALLLEDGIGEVAALEMYTAVHLFGQTFWNMKG
jgi:hypothetical protein